MLEQYKNYEIEDYKLLGNCYHLKLKDGAELVCEVAGEVIVAEGERHLDNGVLKSVNVSQLGRRITKDNLVQETSSVNVLTNRGMFCLKFSNKRSLKDITQPVSNVGWAIH